MAGLTHFDFANYLTTIEAIMKDLLSYNATGTNPTAFGYYRQTSNKIRGFYFDLWGGGQHFLQYSPSVSPNGNGPHWEPNKRTLSAYLRTQMVGIDSAFYTTTESPEEGLIGSIDAMHCSEFGIVNSTYGQFSGAFGTVYSRYQCVLSLSTVFTDTSLASISGQGPYYSALINASFHQTGGHICINNRTGYTLVPVFPPDLNNCPQYYTIVFIYSMILKMNATPAIRTYMRNGLRMRPLPASWEGDYIESGVNLFSHFANQIGVDEGFYVSSSVWLNPAADADYPSTRNVLGIVISSATTKSPGYKIRMDAVAYGLSPTQPKALYSRVGAVRTELTRFTDILDHDIVVTFDGSSAALQLYEVAYV